MSAQKSKQGDSTVALVKSIKQDAEKITDAEVREMVREAVHLAGGLSGIVRDGQSVVIKPNLVTTRSFPGTLSILMAPVTDPAAESVQVPQLVNGITTDRRVVRAMVELVRELNPSGKVYVMECAGDGPTSGNFQRMGYNHENIPGVDEFRALGENGAYRDVDSDDLVAVEAKNQLYKKLPGFLKNKYYFDKTYYNADVIISLCCLKNHSAAAVTGGIKNVGIGARPACIYSLKKSTISVFAIGHAWEPLNNFIHDYYSAKPVDFVLCDGLQGLSWGPAAQGAPSYEKAKMNMRVIMASKDAVACDAVQSCIVGVDPEKVKYLKDLSQDGFGEIDMSRISVRGNVRVDEIKRRFPLPGGLLGAVASGGAKKAVYEDFDPPDINIEKASLTGREMTLDIKADPKVVRIELYVDCELAEVFPGGSAQLKHCFDVSPSKGAHVISIYAYDRFLNCGIETHEFEA